MLSAPFVSVAGPRTDAAPAEHDGPTASVQRLRSDRGRLPVRLAAAVVAPALRSAANAQAQRRRATGPVRARGPPTAVPATPSRALPAAWARDHPGPFSRPQPPPAGPVGRDTAAAGQPTGVTASAREHGIDQKTGAPITH